MPFSQMWSIIKARWKSSAVLLFVLVALVAMWSLLTPKVYTATASILLDVRTPDPVGGAGVPVLAQNSYMATQIDLIQTRRVTERALRSLKINEDPRQRELWLKSTQGKGDFDAWLSAQVQKQLVVKPARESSILTVNYSAYDPQAASDMANAIVKAYVDTSLELKTEPAKQYNAFFDERARQLRGALEAAQARLSAYQQSKGIVATDERVDVENARLSELSTQLSVMQGVTAESRGREREAGDNSQEVLNNTLIANVGAELARQQARLDEVRERLGDNHPQVQELQAHVSRLRQQLTAESKRVAGSLSINNTVNGARLAAVKAAIEEQRARILKLKTMRDEAAVLVRDVDSAQRTYDAALARVSQANTESQNTLTNVSIVGAATPPERASSPRVFLNIAASFVVGLFLAIGWALLRETTDRRMRFESDADLLHMPLLVTIPRGDSKGSETPVRLTSGRPVVTALIGANK